MKNLSLLIKYGIFCLIPLPILFYIWFIWTYTTNVPFFDDFYWALKYLDTYLKTSSFSEKLALVFEQHNQHRIAFFHSIIIMFYKIEGEINFRHLVLFGNLSIFGIGLLFYAHLKRLKLELIAFLPVTFWWYQLQYFHNSITTYGLPNLSIIFWGITSIYFATSRKKTHLLIAIIAGAISMFSNGNGLIILPIVTGIRMLHKDYKGTLAIIVVYITLLGVYFSNFKMNSEEVQLGLKTFYYFLDFLSAAFFIQNVFTARIIILIMLFIMATWALRLVYKTLQNNDKNHIPYNLFTLGLILFLLGTAAMTALVRAIHNIGIPTWYKNYSLLFVLAFYLVLLSNFSFKKFRLFIISIVGFTGIFVWFKTSLLLLPQVDSFSSTLRADSRNFKNHAYWAFLPAQVGFPNYEKFNALNKVFLDKGLYTLPTHKEPNTEDIRIIKSDNIIVFYPIQADSLSTEMQIDLSKITNTKTIIHKSIVGFIQNKSTKESYYLGRFPILNGKINTVKKMTFFSNDKINISIANKYFSTAIHPGNYVIGVAYEDDKGLFHRFLTTTTYQIKTL